MPFPKTIEEMFDAGYKELNDSNCRYQSCGEEITWWETPKGKKIAMDKHTATPHWATCHAAESFKKKR